MGTISTHAEPLAFSQNRFIPANELTLAINDAGFVWGATVTDLCRTFQHQLYRFGDHLGRFRQSCQAIAIDVSLTDADISAAAEQLVRHNSQLIPPGEELIIVMLGTPGLIGYYTGQPTGVGGSGPTFIMHTFPLPRARYRHLFETGAKLHVPRVRHVPAECVDPRIKQRSRLHWWLAEHEVHRHDPTASALLLNEAGHVTETALANFLMVRGGEVFTPREHSILGGISRQVVRRLCGELAIAWHEADLTLAECLTADEAMLTSTAFCIAGVKSINDRPLRWPGPIFERLLRAWSDQVGQDIRRFFAAD